MAYAAHRRAREKCIGQSHALPSLAEEYYSQCIVPCSPTPYFQCPGMNGDLKMKIAAKSILHKLDQKTEKDRLPFTFEEDWTQPSRRPRGPRLQEKERTQGSAIQTAHNYSNVLKARRPGKTRTACQSLLLTFKSLPQILLSSISRTLLYLSHSSFTFNCLSCQRLFAICPIFSYFAMIASPSCSLNLLRVTSCQLGPFLPDVSRCAWLSLRMWTADLSQMSGESLWQ